MRKVILTVKPANPITKSGKPDRRFKPQRDKAKAKAKAKFMAEHKAQRDKRKANWVEVMKAKPKAVDDMLLKFDGMNWTEVKNHPTVEKIVDNIFKDAKPAPEPAPEPATMPATMPGTMRAGTYALNNIVKVARSLHPVAGTEYARGVTELIGRLVLDVSGLGEGTSENAKIFSLLVCKP